MEYIPKNESFMSMSCRNFIYGLIGIIFGLVINSISQKINKKLKIENKNLKIIMQLFICSISLGYVHTILIPQFGWSWQNLTEGLFFISFFFGVQYSVFSDIQELSYDL